MRHRGTWLKWAMELLKQSIEWREEKEERKARKTKKGGELEMEMHLAFVYPQEVTIGQFTKQSFCGGKATLRMRWH